jgi:AFG3 family protein
MRSLLGKRPFDRGDDMDKWLDENQKQTQPTSPPPLVPEGSLDPPLAPAPMFKRIEETR